MITLRTLKYFVAGTAVVALASFAAMPQASAAASMADSKHDLSNTSTTGIYSGAGVNGTDQICVFCHTPHNATISAGPLWNRAAGSATVTLYSNADGHLTGAMSGSLNKQSAVCLSCHDGTVAFDAFTNKPGTGDGAATFTFTGTSDKKMTGATNTAALVSGDLSNDHPVSITYDDASPSLIATPTDVVLFNDGTDDYVECASCHDPHGDGTNDMFLRASLTGSQICLSCHDK